MSYRDCLSLPHIVSQHDARLGLSLFVGDADELRPPLGEGIFGSNLKNFRGRPAAPAAVGQAPWGDKGQSQGGVEVQLLTKGSSAYGSLGPPWGV